MAVHLVIPDQHADPSYHNNRATLVGKLIADVKPDVVINLGDAVDMASLSSFDKGKASFHGQQYGNDIEAHLDFQDKLWAPMRKSKRKQPRRIFLEGNHEHRIKRVIDQDHHLGGDTYGVSFKNLQLDKWYHDVIEYTGGTPGIVNVDGVNYAHFFVSGVMGRPIGGEHHATSLINKNYASCTQGHSHLVDWAVRTNTQGKKIMGCVAGVLQDYHSPWAGHVNDLWWSGVVIKRGVEDGVYDPQFISLKQLEIEYG